MSQGRVDEFETTIASRADEFEPIIYKYGNKN